MKILHLSDNDKFIKWAHDNYEGAFPGQNYVVLNSDNGNTQIFKSKNSIELSYSRCASKVVQLINDSDIIIIHKLDYAKACLVAKSKNNKIFLWNIWGGDFPITRSLYDNDTLTAIKRIDPVHYYKHKIIHFLDRHLFIGKPPFNPRTKRIYKKALRKIKYCTTVVPNEASVYSRIYDKIYLLFNYGNINQLIPHNLYDDIPNIGNNIMVGHSAHYNVNHLSILKTIQDFDLQGRDIVLPLSYGHIRYKNEILSYCMRNQIRHRAIMSFLPLADYGNIVKSCNVFISNTYNQCALGNIVLMLWIGAKVFLREENPIYEFFKDLGIVLYSIQECLRNQESLDSIDSSIALQNRTVLDEYYSDSNVYSRIRNTLHEILHS